MSPQNPSMVNSALVGRQSHHQGFRVGGAALPTTPPPPGFCFCVFWRWAEFAQRDRDRSDSIVVALLGGDRSSLCTPSSEWPASAAQTRGWGRPRGGGVRAGQLPVLFWFRDALLAAMPSFSPFLFLRGLLRDSLPRFLGWTRRRLLPTAPYTRRPRSQDGQSPPTPAGPSRAADTSVRRCPWLASHGFAPPFLRALGSLRQAQPVALRFQRSGLVA